MIIEKVVLNYLLSADLSVGSSVYCEVPVDPEEEYVLIEKIGGGRTDRIDLARIDIKSCAKTLERAMEINYEIIEAMDGLPVSCAGVFGCDLNYNNNFTNPATKTYRYQAGFNIFY